MKATLFPSALAICFLLAAGGLLNLPAADPVNTFLDGLPVTIELENLPANTLPGPEGRTIDIVGDTSNSATAAGRAKGNSYRVDTGVTLTEAEFWLNFTSTQTLTYYLFVCPVEFGTYTEVYRASESVTGHGADWYSSGLICIGLTAGNHYIIAVSWDGTLTYYFGTGDSQATSFGAYTHGYATGYDPLPASFESLVNDQAIYHQRLTTDVASPVEASSWGAIKAFYR